MSSLTFYAISEHAPEIVPASHTREWMDKTPERFSYRCLPLNIANALGWDILCPFSFSASWNGQVDKSAITILPDDQAHWQQQQVLSHFGSGVITFHIGYILRTASGWNTLVTGSLNNPKDGIIPLSGIVETDWLPFSFTMNWRFTKPGIAHFDKGEPLCTLIPIPHDMLDNVVPEIRMLSSDPELAEAHEKWSKSRGDFLKDLSVGEAGAMQQGWQKHYFRGQVPWDPKNPHETHKSKLRLASPIDLRQKSK